MTLRYIFHSGFLLETEQSILIFDYWMDPANVVESFIYPSGSKHVYVFASHFHEDHFNKDIFKWRQNNPFSDYTYILSGLTSWAFYDNNDTDAVSAPFGSGCSSIISFAVRENRTGGRRCFLGMLDPSARPRVPKNELTFVIPTCRFKEMLCTMRDSALFQHVFSIVKKRINGEIQKDSD